MLHGPAPMIKMWMIGLCPNSDYLVWIHKYYFFPGLRIMFSHLHCLSHCDCLPTWSKAVPSGNKYNMSAQTEPLPSGESYYGGHGPAIVAVCWPLLAIGIILVSLRIYTYLTIVKNIGGWAIIWACVALVRSLRCRTAMDTSTDENPDPSCA
jgi:hypothetical protein